MSGFILPVFNTLSVGLYTQLMPIVVQETGIQFHRRICSRFLVMRLKKCSHQGIMFGESGPKEASKRGPVASY